MPRRGENIYRRKDGRWEGRYVIGRIQAGRTRFGYIWETVSRGQGKVLRRQGRAVHRQAGVPAHIRKQYSGGVVGTLAIHAQEAAGQGIDLASLCLGDRQAYLPVDVYS